MTKVPSVGGTDASGAERCDQVQSPQGRAASAARQWMAMTKLVPFEPPWLSVPLTLNETLPAPLE